MGITHSSIVQAPIEDVFAWHTGPGAFSRLSPPRQPVHLRAESDSLNDGEAILALPDGTRKSSPLPTARARGSPTAWRRLWAAPPPIDVRLPPLATRRRPRSAAPGQGKGRPAAEAGIRVTNVRTGIVQSRRGGTLRLFRTLFQLGLGGRISTSEQWLSWIDIDDLIDMYNRALFDPDLSGPVNAVASHPVRNT